MHFAWHGHATLRGPTTERLPWIVAPSESRVADLSRPVVDARAPVGRRSAGVNEVHFKTPTHTCVHTYVGFGGGKQASRGKTKQVGRQARLPASCIRFVAIHVF